MGMAPAENSIGLHVPWIEGMGGLFSLQKVDEHIFGFRDKMIISTEEQPVQGFPPPVGSYPLAREFCPASRTAVS